MKNKKFFKTWKPVVLLVAVLLFAGVLTAAEVQKVGTTSMQSMRIASSVRAIGMGETYVSVADDIQSIFWNPAGLIHVENGAAIFSQINMPADVQFNTAGMVKNFDRKGVLGVHILSMTTDDMPVRTIYYPEGTGENFMAYDFVAGISYAQRLTDRFIFGTNVRFLTTGIDEITHTSGIVDFGTLYETALRSIKIGMAIQNFGPDIDYEGHYNDWLDKGRRNREEAEKKDYTGAPPPTIYRLGVSANFFTLTGIVKPNDLDGIFAIEMSHPNDNRERLNVGCEFSWMDMVALRGGYKIRYKNVFGYDEERWTAGFGIKVPIPGEVDFIFDYAYLDFGQIGEAADGFMSQPHRFSISLNF